MPTRRRPFIAVILSLTVIVYLLWYFDPFHKSVENVDQLIGQDYNYALDYFGSKPNSSSSFSINGDLNEFQGGVLSQAEKLKDSLINQHTWKFTHYKVTIWVGKTQGSEREIIDAIRYKNSVRF